MISSSNLREEVDRLKVNLESLKADATTTVRDFESQKEKSITSVVEHNRQILSVLCSRLRRRYNEIPLDRVGQNQSEDTNLIANIAIVNALDKVLRIIRYKDDGDEFHKIVVHLMKVGEENINNIDTSPNPTDSSQVLFDKIDSAKEAIEAARADVRIFKDLVEEEIPRV